MHTVEPEIAANAFSVPVRGQVSLAITSSNPRRRDGTAKFLIEQQLAGLTR